MKEPAYKGKEPLPLSVYVSARAGDPQAVERLLRYYDNYMNCLCTRTLYDEDGYQKKKNQIQIYQVPIPFLSFPLTPLLAEKRLRRRNGKERKRQHRAQLIYTGKSSRTISTTTFSNRT